MDKNLKELLERKKQSATTDKINWDDRRDKYLEAVEQLYKQIVSVFEEQIDDKTIVVRRHPKQLNESYIGTYTADDLIMLLGDEQVRFSPRGRNIVGAAGRVDVVGERNEAILIYQPESGWAFVQSRQPKLQTAPFNESTLAEILQLVMRD